MATFVNFIPFNTAKQYEEYLARLHRVPQVFEQVIEVLQQGEKDNRGKVIGKRKKGGHKGRPFQNRPALIS